MVKEASKASSASSTSTSATSLETSHQISIVDGNKTGKTLRVNYDGSEFYIPKTKIGLLEYEKYVTEKGISQNDYLHVDCDVLSQNYAVDLMRGTYTPRSIFGTRAAAPAPRINKQVRSQNINDVLAYIYNEINNGRPTALQVTQRRSNEGLRHFVTVVGYDASVKSYTELTPDKILVLDCVDGKVQRLSDRNRSLFNQAQNGYYALGATDVFLAKEVYKTEQKDNT